MYCKDCIHWERHKEFYQNKNYGRCNSEKFTEHYPNKDENDNLVSWDGEGYSAGAETGEMFGCVHFKSNKY